MGPRDNRLIDRTAQAPLPSGSGRFPDDGHAAERDAHRDEARALAALWLAPLPRTDLLARLRARTGRGLFDGVRLDVLADRWLEDEGKDAEVLDLVVAHPDIEGATLARLEGEVSFSQGHRADLAPFLQAAARLSPSDRADYDRLRGDWRDAEHLDTPYERLRELAADPRAQRSVFRRLAARAAYDPDYPVDLQIRLMGSEDVLVRESMLWARAPGVEMVRMAARDPVPVIRALAARNPVLEPADLDALAADEEPSVRAAAASAATEGHPLLVILAGDPEASVRVAAARNHGLDPRVLEHLILTESDAFIYASLNWPSSDSALFQSDRLWHLGLALRCHLGHEPLVEAMAGCDLLPLPLLELIAEWDSYPSARHRARTELEDREDKMSSHEVIESRTRRDDLGKGAVTRARWLDRWLEDYEGGPGKVPAGVPGGPTTGDGHEEERAVAVAARRRSLG